MNWSPVHVPQPRNGAETDTRGYMLPPRVDDSCISSPTPIGMAEIRWRSWDREPVYYLYVGAQRIEGFDSLLEAQAGCLAYLRRVAEGILNDQRR